MGLRPYYNPKSVVSVSKNISTNRVRRQQSLPEPLAPYDGNLDINSNYTAFIEIIGTCAALSWWRKLLIFLCFRSKRRGDRRLAGRLQQLPCYDEPRPGTSCGRAFELHGAGCPNFVRTRYCCFLVVDRAVLVASVHEASARSSGGNDHFPSFVKVTSLYFTLFD